MSTHTADKMRKVYEERIARIEEELHKTCKALNDDCLSGDGDLLISFENNHNSLAVPIRTDLSVREFGDLVDLVQGFLKEKGDA